MSFFFVFFFGYEYPPVDISACLFLLFDVIFPFLHNTLLASLEGTFLV
jgi:hypothetical protein